jgi:hypothetical protein
MTVNEPATLVKPFVWNAYFVWNPAKRQSLRVHARGVGVNQEGLLRK